MAMKDDQSVMVKFTVEEVKITLQVLDAFRNLVKVCPAKKEKRQALKLTSEALVAIMDKLQSKIKDERKEVEENEG